jgi:hypothetical protein
MKDLEHNTKVVVRKYENVVCLKWNTFIYSTKRNQNDTILEVVFFKFENHEF